MERIKTRHMSSFIWSTFINLGIGFVFGVIIALYFIMLFGGAAALVLWSYPLAYALLAFIFSANLYRMYFYYTLSMDINAICEGDGEESESYVTALVLSFITLGAYRIYWTYKLAKRLRANAPRYGIKMLETGKDIAILNTLSFGFIGAWELIKYTNRIARVYNQTGLPEVVGGVQ